MNYSKKFFINYLTIFVLFFALMMRLIEHPANFAPLGAMSLFMGYYLVGKKKFLAPLLILLASDLFLGFYNLGVMFSVYGSFVLIVLLGHLTKNWSKNYFNSKVLTLTVSTFAGSVLFYLVTNAAVWLFTSLYPHNLIGLGSSYLMALPFFRNTLMSDVFYTAIFFTTMELVLWFSRLATSVYHDFHKSLSRRISGPWS